MRLKTTGSVQKNGRYHNGGTHVVDSAASHSPRFWIHTADRNDRGMIFRMKTRNGWVLIPRAKQLAPSKECKRDYNKAVQRWDVVVSLASNSRNRAGFRVAMSQCIACRSARRSCPGGRKYHEAIGAGDKARKRLEGEHWRQRLCNVNLPCRL